MVKSGDGEGRAETPERGRDDQSNGNSSVKDAYSKRDGRSPTRSASDLSLPTNSLLGKSNDGSVRKFRRSIDPSAVPPAFRTAERYASEVLLSPRSSSKLLNATDHISSGTQKMPLSQPKDGSVRKYRRSLEPRAGEVQDIPPAFRTADVLLSPRSSSMGLNTSDHVSSWTQKTKSRKPAKKKASSFQMLPTETFQRSSSKDRRPSRSGPSTPTDTSPGGRQSLPPAPITGETGDILEEESMLEVHLVTSKALKGDKSKTSTYNTILQTLVDSDRPDPQKALNILATMKKNKVSPDDTTWALVDKCSRYHEESIAEDDEIDSQGEASMDLDFDMESETESINEILHVSFVARDDSEYGSEYGSEHGSEHGSEIDTSIKPRRNWQVKQDLSQLPPAFRSSIQRMVKQQSARRPIKNRVGNQWPPPVSSKSKSEPQVFPSIAERRKQWMNRKLEDESDLKIEYRKQWTNRKVEDESDLNIEYRKQWTNRKLEDESDLEIEYRKKERKQDSKERSRHGVVKYMRPDDEMETGRMKIQPVKDSEGLSSVATEPEATSQSVVDDDTQTDDVNIAIDASKPSETDQIDDPAQDKEQIDVSTSNEDQTDDSTPDKDQIEFSPAREEQIDDLTPDEEQMDDSTPDEEHSEDSALNKDQEEVSDAADDSAKELQSVDGPIVDEEKEEQEAAHVTDEDEQSEPQHDDSPTPQERKEKEDQASVADESLKSENEENTSNVVAATETDGVDIGGAMDADSQPQKEGGEEDEVSVTEELDNLEDPLDEKSYEVLLSKIASCSLQDKANRAGKVLRRMKERGLVPIGERVKRLLEECTRIPPEIPERKPHEIDVELENAAAAKDAKADEDYTTPTQAPKKRVRFAATNQFRIIRRRRSIGSNERWDDPLTPPKRISDNVDLAPLRFSSGLRDNRPSLPRRSDSMTSLMSVSNHSIGSLSERSGSSSDTSESMHQNSPQPDRFKLPFSDSPPTARRNPTDTKSRKDLPSMPQRRGSASYGRPRQPDMLTIPVRKTSKDNIVLLSPQAPSRLPSPAVSPIPDASPVPSKSSPNKRPILRRRRSISGIERPSFVPLTPPRRVSAPLEIFLAQEGLKQKGTGGKKPALKQEVKAISSTDELQSKRGSKSPTKKAIVSPRPSMPDDSEEARSGVMLSPVEEATEKVEASVPKSDRKSESFDDESAEDKTTTTKTENNKERPLQDSDFTSPAQVTKPTTQQSLAGITTPGLEVSERSETPRPDDDYVDIKPAPSSRSMTTPQQQTNSIPKRPLVALAVPNLDTSERSDTPDLYEAVDREPSKIVRKQSSGDESAGDAADRKTRRSSSPRSGTSEKKLGTKERRGSRRLSQKPAKVSPRSTEPPSPIIRHHDRVSDKWKTMEFNAVIKSPVRVKGVVTGLTGDESTVQDEGSMRGSRHRRSIISKTPTLGEKPKVKPADAAAWESVPLTGTSQKGKNSSTGKSKRRSKASSGDQEESPTLRTVGSKDSTEEKS